MVFTEFYLVLPSFRRFYWVLPLVWRSMDFEQNSLQEPNPIESEQKKIKNKGETPVDRPIKVYGMAAAFLFCFFFTRRLFLEPSGVCGCLCVGVWQPTSRAKNSRPRCHGDVL